MSTITIIHASGWFGANADDFHADLTRQRRAASIITRTEAHGRALGLDPAWRVYRARGDASLGNCSIEWDSRRWERRAETIERLDSQTRWWSKSGVERATYAVTVILDGEDGPLCVSVAHYPPNVQNPSKTGFAARSRRALATRSAAAEHRRVVRRLCRAYRAEHGVAVRRRIVVADWNVDLSRPWARAWLRSVYAGGRWRLAVPPVPTIHRSVFDAAVIRGLRLAGTPGVRNVGSSDHHEVTFRLRGVA